MRHFVIFLVFTISIFASTLEDEAYKAYKNQNYTKAFKLYKDDAKNHNLKSMLMVGVFFEKGLSVPQDKKLALKIYKAVIKEIKYKHTLKDLKIISISLNRAYAITKDNRYKQILSKINKIFYKSNEPKELNKDIQEYLNICPAAKVVESKYQEGIWQFDCDLFNKFPKRMALFMKLRYLREKAFSNDQNELVAKVDNKIDLIIDPIIKYLQNDMIDCYSKAIYNTDIKSCNYDFFVKTDPLKFKNYSNDLAKRLSNDYDIEYRLSTFEKQKLINKLIDIFSGNSSVKNIYYHIVKVQ